MPIRKIFLLYMLFSVSTLTFARPKVALVLSGGGAKGLAEIPLIEALEEEGIKPDMVLGTSMGALIGSLYASGYTPKEIRKTMLEMDYIKVLGERPVSLEKVPADDFSLRCTTDTEIALSVQRERIGSAPGLIGDQNILAELTNHLSRVLPVDDFDSLPIPFRCVATNVSNGEPILLHSGSIVDAVRASISLPGVFTPAPLGNGIYAMDGGLRNNLPVKIARDMGADIVIAMDVASIVDTDPKTLSDLATVSEQIISLIISANAVEQYELATIVLRPDLREYGTVDFFHPKEIVAAGEKCVEENREKIRGIARDLESQGYVLYRNDYDRIGEYDRMKDLRIRNIVITDISFGEEGPLPREKDFARFKGRILDEKTKSLLTEELKERKNQYHLSSFSYYVQKIEGTDECDLILRANHYDQNLGKLFYSGSPSVSVSNLSTHKYVTINPASVFGLSIVDPAEVLFKISVKNGFTGNAAFYLKFASWNGMKLSGEIGGEVRYGSMEPSHYFDFSGKLSDSDRGGSGNIGIRFKYTDLIVVRMGGAIAADKIISQHKVYKNVHLYDEFIFTTLKNSFVALKGIQLQGGACGSRNLGAEWEKRYCYSGQFAYEQRFEILKEKTSAGFALALSTNRLPYEMISGYSNYGGIDGMCGYPLSVLKRDFGIFEVSVRQKLFSFVGMPVYAILQGKAGISDDYDPMKDLNKPENKFLAGDRKIEAGFGAYAAFATPLGNFVAGYSMNTNRKWVITLGLK